MSNFSRRQTKANDEVDYRAEFARLTRALYDKFAVDYTPCDLLLDAMAAVEDEMNRNGGVNWDQGNYAEHLGIVEETLAAEGQFTPDQLKMIKWSLKQIAECGRELKEHGESSRQIKEPIEYLIARVVDWCHAHPSEPDENAK